MPPGGGRRPGERVNTGLHLFNGARSVYEPRKIGFAVYATQRQQVAGLVIEPFFGRHGSAMPGATGCATDAPIRVTVRVAEEIGRLAEFGFESRLRFA